MGPKFAIKAIAHRGILLVYPIDNGKEPPSLWTEAYPRTKMRWEWDDDGDDRVARLWHLRARLSTSKKVIYSKWYRGRATFFSRPVFRAFLTLSLHEPLALSRDARSILSLLEESSPRSTKEIKKESGLQGRLLESTYQKAMKELWNRFLIVGFGEIDDGAFPSLAIGATRWLFEDIYLEAKEAKPADALAELAPFLEKSPKLKNFSEKVLGRKVSRQLEL